MPWLALLAGVSFVACATAPLATYAVTLAAFGGAHVLTELRYVDRRFGARLAGPLWAGIAGLLAVVVFGRIAPWLDLLPRRATVDLELWMIAALALVVIPWTARRAGLATPAALAVAGVVLVGLSASPAHTLLAFAVLHNLTPVGFLADALDGPARRGALAWSAVAFAGLPLLLATGLPATAAAAVGLWAPDASPLPTGPLGGHLGAYLPRAWHDAPWAAWAFSGVVFAQCMHYVVVIGVLPQLDAADTSPGRWIGRVPVVPFTIATVALCAALFAGHTVDFHGARGVYGVIAAVHAWIEVPVLLVALSAASLPAAAPARS